MNKLNRMLPIVGLSFGTWAMAQSSEVPPNDTDTLYDSSFSAGEVVPAVPAEGEPDTAGVEAQNPELNPKDESFYDPEGRGDGDAFRFGLTGTLGIPHVVNVGLETLMHRRFGVSLNYGNVSRNVSGVDVALKHADIRLRYHPFQGAFFAGLGVGQHTLTGEKKKDLSISVNGKNVIAPTTIKVEAKANYIVPHIGWFAIWEPGFTMGLDLGWLVPSGAKAESSVNITNLTDEQQTTLKESAEYKAMKTDVEDATEGAAKKSLPFVSMIRIGWMF